MGLCLLAGFGSQEGKGTEAGADDRISGDFNITVKIEVVELSLQALSFQTCLFRHHNPVVGIEGKEVADTLADDIFLGKMRHFQKIPVVRPAKGV